ncbi:hypothetical protein [Burkholderia ambifaria]|uniref:hypothetical protein n=1 Tax=Burkholderia ambifaria TaxID=152480 RepID=UPI0015900DCC|nr:hypothetical protein [Burkholderia ambifaria]
MLAKLFARVKPKAPKRDRTNLAFRDSESAFQYACKYCDCTLIPGCQIVALVLDASGLPGEAPDFYIIKVASENGGVEVVADPAVPSDVFRAGELVSFWFSGDFDLKQAPKGLINARLMPEFDVELGWKKA